jgi:hypothetical protein
MAKGGSSAAARLAAAEHQRQVVALRIRGTSFQMIGKQIGISKVAAFKLYKRALKTTPKADLEELRKLEAERIADLRQRLWIDLAGKPDPDDPTRIIRPEGETLATLINAAVRLSRHEAMVLGLDAPAKNEIVASVMGRTLDDEELARQWDRLTFEEQDHFMRLLAKLQGRWVEPPSSSIETTAMPASEEGDNND